MKIKLGVVIQGPLITFGQGVNNLVSGFSTLTTIEKNVKNIKKNGFKYIVSTWLPSTIEEQNILSELRHNEIAVCQNEVPKLFDPDHRYKQHYGVYKGAEALIDISDDITYLLKIRTDMLMPEIFWDWIAKAIDPSDNKLYVSELMNRPYYQGDFIYLANKTVFLNFLEVILRHEDRIIHPSIAFDIGMKNCIARNFRKNFILSLFTRIMFFIDFLISSKSFVDNWNVFVFKYIGVIPEDVWNEILWRDRSIKSFMNSTFFKFDNLEIHTNVSFLSNFKTLVNDHKIYYQKSIKYWWRSNLK